MRFETGMTQIKEVVKGEEELVTVPVRANSDKKTLSRGAKQ